MLIRQSPGGANAAPDSVQNGENQMKLSQRRKNNGWMQQSGEVYSVEWLWRKFLRRYKGTFDIFFGIEHRMRKEEMEGIADENASSADRKHTSGGVFVAVDSVLGAVIDKEEGAITSFQGVKEIRPSMDDCQRRYVGFCRVFFGTQKVGRREMKL